MKFMQIEAFDRHLREAFPDHPSQVYALAMPMKDEREWCYEKILRKIREIHTDIEVIETAYSALDIGNLFSPSLFVSTQVIVIEECEGIKKGDALLDELKNISTGVFVILSGATLSKLVYEKVKNDIVLLDLSSEKPWERLERLSQSVKQVAKEANKPLTQDALAFLLQMLPSDFSILSREVEKAICFAGDAPEITLKMVQSICTSRAEVKGWKISEDLIWKGKVNHHPFSDSSEFFALLSQLRYHLTTGLHIAEAIESGGSNFPNLRPKQLQIYKQVASAKKKSYFARGLMELFEMELKAKSTSSPQTLLWDHFTYRLQTCKG